MAKVKVQFRFPQELLDRLDALAEGGRMSRTALVEQCLWALVDGRVDEGDLTMPAGFVKTSAVYERIAREFMAGVERAANPLVEIPDEPAGSDQRGSDPAAPALNETDPVPRPTNSQMQTVREKPSKQEQIRAKAQERAAAVVSELKDQLVTAREMCSHPKGSEQKQSWGVVCGECGVKIR